MGSEIELYRVDQVPIFQNLMYDSAQEARECRRGNVRLVQNLATGLIYNADFRPELITYDVRYQNEQAMSPQFRQHLDVAMQIVLRNMGRENLVEIGCGKGYFLELLIKSGVDVTGFDPAYEGSNPRIQRRYFEPGIVMKAGGLIVRHVIEHIPNPQEFLRNIWSANGGSGLIYIEVPCFDWICARRSWFDVFYEHVNYFRLADFYRMFGRVVDSGHLFGGQYLYVVADLASLTIPQIGEHDRAAFPDNFLHSLSKGANNEISAVWGGASKGVIFSLMRMRINLPVTIAIDINPAKQGKYLPATGIEVHCPEHGMAKLPRGSTIFVMNSNYLDEIKQMSKNAYRYVSVDND